MNEWMNSLAIIVFTVRIFFLPASIPFYSLYFVFLVFFPSTWKTQEEEQMREMIYMRGHSKARWWKRTHAFGLLCSPVVFLVTWCSFLFHLSRRRKTTTKKDAARKAATSCFLIANSIMNRTWWTLSNNRQSPPLWHPLLFFLSSQCGPFFFFGRRFPLRSRSLLNDA